MLVRAETMALLVPLLAIQAPRSLAPIPSGPVHEQADQLRGSRSKFLEAVRSIGSAALADVRTVDDLAGNIAELLERPNLVTSLDVFATYANVRRPSVAEDLSETRRILAYFLGDRVDEAMCDSAFLREYESFMARLDARALLGERVPLAPLPIVVPTEAISLPPRLAQCMLDLWKGRIAGVVLVHVFHVGKRLPHALADYLFFDLILGAKRSFLAILASARVEVPTNLLPMEQRFDAFRELAAYNDMERAIESAPTYNRNDPDASIIFY